VSCVCVCVCVCKEIKIHKTVILPVLLYVGETWSLILREKDESC